MSTIEFVDQTLRDGIGSLWGHRVNSEMIAPIATMMDESGYAAIDMPVTAVHFPMFVRYFGADPWEEVDRMLAFFPRAKRRIPLRARSVQFSLVADAVVELWMERICAHGINSFWLQDVMYNIDDMARVVPVAKTQGAEVMGAIMYGLSPYHTDTYFADKARELAAIAGIDGIYIEDTAGVLTPDRAATLLPAILVEAGPLPVELHVHNTTGLAPLVYLEAVKRGIRILHTSSSTLANGPSLPSTEQTVANIERLGYECPLRKEYFEPIARHLRLVAERQGYATGVPVEYDTAVYVHQLPGGMMGSLERQLGELGVEEPSASLQREIGRVRADLGFPIMATPISQFVGTQAVLNAVSGSRYSVVPDEVIRYVLGHYGTPAGPIADEVRDKVLSTRRARELATWQQEQLSRRELRSRMGAGISDDELVRRLLVTGGDHRSSGRLQGSSDYRRASVIDPRLLAEVLDRPSIQHFHFASRDCSLSCSRALSSAAV